MCCLRKAGRRISQDEKKLAHKIFKHERRGLDLMKGSGNEVVINTA